MTEEQAIDLLSKMDIIIQNQDSLLSRINEIFTLIENGLANFSHGIRFLMIGVALFIFWFVSKLLWGLFAKWFLGGV